MANSPFPGRTPALRVLDASVPATPLLQGRVLLHENARFVPQMRTPLDDDLGGVVMSGEKAGVNPPVSWRPSYAASPSV
jgi:hypothetical protein